MSIQIRRDGGNYIINDRKLVRWEVIRSQSAGGRKISPIGRGAELRWLGGLAVGGLRIIKTAKRVLTYPADCAIRQMSASIHRSINLAKELTQRR
jgi:hypothetical protein